MPILPINYNNCVMYKIVCSDVNVTEIYVGHTTDFIRRKKHHKSNCHNENSKSYNLKVYDFIREHGGFENWDMVLVEKNPCLDSQEACKRERYWIENLRATLNMRVPSRGKKEGDKEYRLNNAEKKKEYQANNAGTIKEYQKHYQAINAETIKEQKKAHYQANIDTIKEKKCIYYQNNIEKSKDYYKQNAETLKAKTDCDCGGRYSHANEAKHFKTGLHIAYCSKIKS